MSSSKSGAIFSTTIPSGRQPAPPTAASRPAPASQPRKYVLSDGTVIQAQGTSTSPAQTTVPQKPRPQPNASAPKQPAPQFQAPAQRQVIIGGSKSAAMF
jgi:hypothetical protein